MTGMQKRAILLTVAVAIVIGTLACSSSLVSRREDATATPTKTLKPTFTATLTPTETPIPTDTPMPTNTVLPTDTPAPTNTPVVFTATPSPAPTDTPTATDTPRPPTRTPTRTRRPATRTPTPRPPTRTPAPQFAWTGTPAGTFSNCGLTAFMGLTLDRSGAVAGDIWIHYWTDGWDGSWALSEWTVNEGYPGLGDERNWDGIIDNYAKPGTWYACVVAQQSSWDCISNRMTMVSVAEPCEDGSGGVQILRIVFQKN